MKNQIIKKIMAYLLVGAMVITTPMTASANELENAYATEEDEDGNPVNNSRTGTSTSTNTTTQSIELPEYIDKYLPSIIGISLDKTSLEFGELKETNVLQARALFDTYDASAEEMQWVGENEKKAVEAEINWFSDDYSVATIGHVWNTWNGDNVIIDENGEIEKAENEDGSKTKQGNKAQIVAVGEGVTTIYAWIEADGQVYTNAPQRPTPGDFIAKATVTVRGQSVTDISFDDTQVPWVIKRQYDLTKYTKIVYGEGENRKEKDVAEYSGSVVYGLLDPTPLPNQSKAKAKATLTDAGILKITAGQAGEKINFTITTESGCSITESIELITPVSVSKIAILPDSRAARVSLDMGSADVNTNEDGSIIDGYNEEKQRVEKAVSVQLYKKGDNGEEPTDWGGVTDDLIWTSNKPAIADVEGAGDKAVIYTAGAVGTAKITVKATSGKSASFTVTVTATPNDIELKPASTYTGKAITMTTILKGANGLELPQGKTKLSYIFIDDDDIDIETAANAKKYYAKVSNKGVVTPKNILSKDGGKTCDDLVKLLVQVTGNLSGTSFTQKTAKAIVEIKQSNLAGLNITAMEKGLIKETNTERVDWYAIAGQNWDTKNTKLALSGVYVGNTYRFDPSCGNKTDELLSIVWTSTGKGIRSALDGYNYKSEITGSANATIKASYIELSQTATKTTAAKKTKTITIKPIQMAQSLVLDKPVQVVNIGYKAGNLNNGNVLKDTTVTIKVKALDPKTSKDTIQWKVLTADATNTNETGTQKTPIAGVKIALTDRNGYASVDNKIVNKDGSAGDSVTNTSKNKTLKVTIPAGTACGSVIKVGAYASGGAVAYGYIYVTKPTSKFDSVEVEQAEQTIKANGTTVKNSWDITLGQEEKAQIQAGLVITGNGGTEVVEAGTPKWTTGDTSAYEYEYVTYTLDKKSALIIQIDSKGVITPLKAGKATVTIKTASGKKSQKITINVKAKPSQGNE